MLRAAVSAPSITSPYTVAVLADNPKGWWRLGEAVGATTAVDYASSGSAPDLGTYTNVALGSLGGIAIDPDTSASFNGTSSYLQIPNSSDLSMSGYTPFTVEMWVNPDDIAQEGTIFEKIEGSGVKLDVWARLDAGGRATFLLRNSFFGEWYSATSASSMPVGAWTHLALTYDGNHNMGVFVNGVHEGSGRYFWSSGDANSAPVSVGRLRGGSSYFPGKLDEVAFYNGVALSGGRILAHYQAGVSNALAGSALYLDGVDDYIRMPDPGGTDLSAYTLEAWVNPASINAQTIVANVVSGSEASSFNHFLRITSAGQFEHYLNDGATRTVTGSTTVVPGTWYHVAGVAQDNGPMRLFVNGIEEGTSLNVGAIDTPSVAGQYYAVGRAAGNNAWTSGYFEGFIDEVRLWNTARSQEQVSAAKNLKLMGSEAGLLGLWRVDDGSGTTVSDGSGAGGRNASLAGGPVWVPSIAPINLTSTGAKSGDEDAAIAITGLAVDSGAGQTGSRQVSLAVGNGTLTMTQRSGLTFTLGDGTSDAQMTFSGRQAAVNAALATLAYTGATNWSGSDLLTAGAGGATLTVPITVSAVNDAPLVTTSGGSANLVKGTGPVVVDPALTVAEAEGDNLESATVQITTNFQSGEDVLAFVNQLGITGTWNAGTGTLALTGPAPAASYQTALRSITYNHTIGNVDIGPRTVSFRAISGTTESAAATRNVALLGFNPTPSPSTAYTAAVLADNPKGWWRLGDLAGSSAVDYDPTGQFDEGSYSYVTLGADGALGGDPDRAATLDGASSRVQIPHSTDLSLSSSNSFTVEAWVNPVNGSQSGTIFEKVGTNGGTLSVLARYDSGKVTMGMNREGWYYWSEITSAGSVPANSWTHLAFTYRAASDHYGYMKIYINGVQDPSSGIYYASSAATANSDPVSIGYLRKDNNSYFNGSIDEVALYRNELSGSTIAAHYLAGRALLAPGPQAGAEDTNLPISGFNLVNPAEGNGAFTTRVQASSGTVNLVTTTGLTFGPGTNGSADFTFSANAASAKNALNSMVYRGSSNWSGADTLSITTDGGTGKNPSATVPITVSAVNDLPTITGIAGQTVDEDGATGALPFTVGDIESLAGDIILTGSSSNSTLVPAANVSFGGSGANRTVMVAPAADRNGTATITVTATDPDGGASSTSFALTVNPVNDAPVAIGESYTINEDTTLTVAVPGILANDTDIDSGALTAVWTAGPDHGALTLSADGSFSYTPAANYNGPDSFTYRANDGSLNSGLATVSIAVNAVNDAPVFVKGSDLRAIEGRGLLTISGWATGIAAGPADEVAAGQVVSFLVENGNNGLFKVQPAVSSDGTLTFRPAYGNAGSVTVSVVARDSGGTTNGGIDSSAPQTFSVTVDWEPEDDRPPLAPPSPTPLTPAPSAVPTAAPVPFGDPTPGREVSEGVAYTAGGRYFPETRYSVGGDAFWNYFNRRGGVRTFGFPISREFVLDGHVVQLFQRAVMQLRADGSVALLNMLDPASPYRLANLPPGFPSPGDGLLRAAPSPSDPEYGARALEFIRSTVPDSWDGAAVGFLSAYMSSVSAADAYPSGGGDLHLLPLLNLEIWGLPTSRPARDPANSNFVYQRFQRGILHYDATSGWTQGVLLGDGLKTVLIGKGILPDDR